jgi:hypothetical protein
VPRGPATAGMQRYARRARCRLTVHRTLTTAADSLFPPLAAAIPAGHPAAVMLDSLRARDVAVGYGTPVEASKSVFVGFAALGRFDSFADVEGSFLQMVRDVAASDATHPCMFAVMLTNGAIRTDDDGEHGAGRRLGDVLKELCQQHSVVPDAGLSAAVAVTRYYGGTPLGKRRWHLIRGVASSAFADAAKVQKGLR